MFETLISNNPSSQELNPTLTRTGIIRPTDNVGGQLFGFVTAMSADGNYLLVNSAFDSSETVRGGSVSLFKRVNDSFEFVQKFTPGNPTSDDRFGDSLAIDGDGQNIFIGYSSATASGLKNAGAVYHYRKVDGVYVRATLISSQPVVSQAFGSAISVSDDGLFLVVGTSRRYTSSQIGRVTVFKRNINGSYSIASNYVCPDAIAGDGFGEDVKISRDGKVVYVSSPLAKFNNLTCHIYRYLTDATGALNQMQRIRPAVVSTTETWNSAMTCDTTGDTLVVGNFGYQTNKGRAFIFTKTDAYANPAIIQGTGTVAQDVFGRDVSITGDARFISIGSIARTVDGVTNAGQVFNFVKVGGVYSQYSVLSPVTPVSGGNFGRRIAASKSGDIVTVSCYGDNVPATNTGSVTTYKRTI